MIPAAEMKDVEGYWLELKSDRTNRHGRILTSLTGYEVHEEPKFFERGDIQRGPQNFSNVFVASFNNFDLTTYESIRTKHQGELKEPLLYFKSETMEHKNGTLSSCIKHIVVRKPNAIISALNFLSKKDELSPVPSWLQDRSFTHKLNGKRCNHFDFEPEFCNTLQLTPKFGFTGWHLDYSHTSAFIYLVTGK